MTTIEILEKLVRITICDTLFPLLKNSFVLQQWHVPITGHRQDQRRHIETGEPAPAVKALGLLQNRILVHGA